MNCELLKLEQWCKTNKLSRNEKKTKYMIFNNKNSNHALPTEKLKINNKQIDSVNEFNFLGVTIDSDLNWNAHAQKIHSKISRTLGVLKKIKRIAPPSTLLTMYTTMVYSPTSTMA